MGADFLFQSFAVPKVNGKPVKLKVAAALKAIAKTDWSENENVQLLLGGDNEEMRSALRAAVEEIAQIFQLPVNRRRDVGWLERENELILLTGGMSWGDAPTDLFDTLRLLSLSGVCDILAGKRDAMNTNSVAVVVDEVSLNGEPPVE